MEKRNTNFDLLKILAMLGIVLFHHFGTTTPNHFVELADGFSGTTYFYDFLNNTNGHVTKISLVMDFCYSHLGEGGNFIFMIITGYFLFGRSISFPKRIRKAAGVLYAILFYGIVHTVIHIFMLKYYYPLDSDSTFRPLFSLPNWLGGETLWYLQAFGCFILFVLPLLKLFENKLTQKTHLCLALALLFVPFLAYEKYFPNLLLSKRILQFITFYYVGGYFSKYRVKISSKILIPLGFSYILLFFAYDYYWRFSHTAVYKPSEYSYTYAISPFICCSLYALLLFLIFNNIKVPGLLAKPVKTLSVSTIGIYCFHYYTISFSFIIADSLGWHHWSGKGFFFFSVMDTLLLFAIGVLLDLVRQYTYKRIEKLASKILCPKSSSDEEEAPA